MYTQITIKNAYFFSLLYIRMNGKNINFEKKKKNEKATFTTKTNKNNI